MSGANRQRALWMLVIFMTGGLLAPVVHRLQHAVHRHHLTEAAAQQPSHVHADRAAFTEALTGISHPDLRCVQCASTSVCADLQRLGPVITRPGAHLAPHVVPRFSSEAFRALPIRAPPHAA